MVCNGRTYCPSEKGLLGSLCQINPLGGIWMRLFDILFSPFFFCTHFGQAICSPLFYKYTPPAFKCYGTYPFRGELSSQFHFWPLPYNPGDRIWPHTNAGSCFSTNTYTHLNRYCTSVCICN